jgi:hypothetical protein
VRISVLQLSPGPRWRTRSPYAQPPSTSQHNADAEKMSGLHCQSRFDGSHAVTMETPRHDGRCHRPWRQPLVPRPTPGPAVAKPLARMPTAARSFTRRTEAREDAIDRTDPGLEAAGVAALGEELPGFRGYTGRARVAVPRRSCAGQCSRRGGGETREDHGAMVSGVICAAFH